MNEQLNFGYIWKGRSWVLEWDGLADQTFQLTEGLSSVQAGLMVALGFNVTFLGSNSADHPLRSNSRIVHPDC